MIVFAPLCRQLCLLQTIVFLFCFYGLVWPPSLVPNLHQDVFYCEPFLHFRINPTWSQFIFYSDYCIFLIICVRPVCVTFRGYNVEIQSKVGNKTACPGSRFVFFFLLPFTNMAILLHLWQCFPLWKSKLIFSFPALSPKPLFPP